MKIDYKIYNEDIYNINLHLNQLLDGTNLTEEIIDYIRHAVKTGKRLRPLFCLLTYDLLGNKERESHHYYTACALELVHNATLIIDDIFDKDVYRRQEKSFYLHFSTFAALAVSYTMSSLAIDWASKSNSIPIIQTLISATHDLAMSLFTENQLRRTNSFASEDEIMELIDRKTATLFQSSTKIGALLANASNEDIERFKLIGLYFGRAYQLHDDLLSLISSIEAEGKSGVISDIQNRVQNFIVLEALKCINTEQVKILEDYYLRGANYPLERIKELLINCGAIEGVKKRIQFYITKIKELLKNYPNKAAKEKIIHLIESLQNQ